MSGKKQSFRFRLPWLPSLVSAPGRSSLSQRSRKSTPASPPVDLVGMDMIPIERHMEEIESEFPARGTRPLAQPESQTPLRIRDLEPIQPPQLNQQQLIEGASLRKPTDAQSPYGKVEAAAREESAEFHIHLSGTDSTPLQLSNTSSAPLQTTPDQATKSQEAESQHLREIEFPLPPATKTTPRSPAKESKLLSPSKGAKLIKQKPQLSKSSSSSSPQKPSPARSKSKPHSPSHAGTSTHANPKPSPDAGNHTRPSAKQLSPDAGNQTRSSAMSSPEASNDTRSSGKQPSPDAGNHTRSSGNQPSPDAGSHTRFSGKQQSPDAGNHTRSSGKQPSPDAGIQTRSSAKQASAEAGIHTRSSGKQPSLSRDADTRTASLPQVPYHTVKFVKTLSKSSPTSSSSSSTSPSSSSPPYSPSSQSSTSSSYLTGESLNSSNKQLTSSPTPKNSPHAQNSKPKTHTSQDMKHRSALPQEESNQPDAIKSTDMESIPADESNTPFTAYDKMAPEPSHKKFKGHPNPSTEEASENEEDESHKPARHKRTRKLFLKRVSPRKKILMPHKDEGESSTIPLYKEIKNDVSNFTHKLSLGQLGHSRSEDHPMSIINISGNNKGATLHLNGKATHQANVANSDTDGSKSQEPQTKHEQQKKMTCINSNMQSINNSLLLKSSIHERNPGVHFGSQVNNTKSTPAGLKRYEPSSTNDVHEKEMTVTTASKLEYNRPIIKRRCLRGLLMESESEADNPDKPRRHGCRVACGDKSKYDF